MHAWLSKYLFYYPVAALKGEFVEKYLRQGRKFQYLPKQQIIQYQEDSLAKLVKFAFEKSTYYQMALKGLSVSLGEACDIDKLPYLDKKLLVDNFSALSTNVFSAMFVSAKTTGGSTGQAVTVLKNSTALARERAVTWRGYEWAGVSLGDPQARFWGVPLASFNRFKYKITDIVANRIRLSAFNLTENSLNEYHKDVTRFSPVYLYGYVSVIKAYVDYLSSNNLALPMSVKAIITTSEVLSDRVRTYIQEITGLRVYNEYGCGEVGSIAHECEHGNMHIMSDNLIVEVDNVGQGNKSTGEIIITDLHNYAMPLIRYRLGDYATFSKDPCPCGRTLPVIEKIHGRAYDLIRLKGGRVLHPEIVMYVFEEFKDRYGVIDQFQFVQTGYDKAILKLVTSNSYKKRDHELILKRKLNEALQASLSFQVEYVDRIPREKSGKLRVVKVLCFAKAESHI